MVGGVALIGLIEAVPALVQKAVKGFGSINAATVKATAEKFSSVATIFSSIAGIGATIGRIGLQAAADVISRAFGAGSGSMLALALTSMKEAINQTILAAHDINVTEEDRQKMDAVSGVLEVLNNFSKTFTSVAEATRPNMAEGLFNINAMRNNTTAVSAALSTMSVVITTFVSTVLTMVSGKSAEDLAKIAPVAELITSLGGIITAVSSAASSIPETDADGFAVAMIRMMSFMNVITTNIRTLFSGVITGLMSVISSKSFDPEKFKAASDAITGIFGGIGAVMTSLTSPAGGTGGAIGSKDPAAIIGPMITSLSTLFSGGTFAAQMTSIIDGMSGVGTAMSPARMEAIAQFSNGIGAISSALTTVSQELTSINSIAVQHVEKGVTALVMSINDIGDSIAAIKGVDLNAELRTLVDRLGLEGRDTLRINHGNYNLTVNLRVTVDTEEFEKALLRPTTTIHFG